MLNNCHLSQLIPAQAARYGERIAMTYRDYARNAWLPITWSEFARQAEAVSRALLHSKVGVQENIAVFSQNKPECLFVDFGAYAVRAVTIPFYATSSGAQVAYMLNDASVRLLFVGEQFQYDTAMSVGAQCPTLERIIIFDPSVQRREGDTISTYLADFLAEGAQPASQAAHDAEIAQRRAQASFDDLANILYTSGTTGASKGVMLTYGMYHEGFRVNDLVVPIGEDDVTLSFLPFTHVFERAWSYLCLAEGAQLAVNLKPQDVLRSLQEVHPTCMTSVPRFWEKVYQGVLEKMDTGSALEKRLIGDALATGKRIWTEYRSQRKPAPVALSVKYALYRRTVIKLLKRTLGLERAHFFPTAGAAVSPDVEKFVHAADIDVIVGYGLTESTATVSCDHGDKPVTLGSVGRLIDGLEIKFSENDEILLRGKTITPGYYRKETTTKATIDADGWFHTGDAGYLKDGELFLKERIKDLFKTSNGKYIAPQMIESKFVIDKYIEQVVIVADRHKFVSALVVPAYGLLEKYAAEHGIAYATREELCQNSEVNRFIGERMDTLQQDLAHYEKVKRFTLLPAAFSVENGELTNTLKIKRSVVYARYADRIAQMYEEAAQH